jgi:tRNA A-37 threonylcarbamoyl transferase component Bud32
MLYAAAAHEAEILSRELDRGAVWERLMSKGDTVTGRGATAIVARTPGPAWRIKRMRRGGLTARVWRDRYPGASRLVALLAASGEAARRGVPTPAAVALLVEREVGPLVRGFLATEEVEGAEDLARRAVRGEATADDVEDAMRAVRDMHDRGLDHPDLNLGNLLVAPAGALPRVHVIDLDRVTFSDRPLSAARRRRAIRRLERSCAKLTGSPGSWSEAYGLTGRP